MKTETPSTYSLPKIEHGFDLTVDQLMIRDMVREFAVNEVAPLAHEIDENHRFPVETWKKIVELGLPGIPFPEEYGGSNGGTLAYCLAVEELSRVCGSTGLTLAAHVSLGTFPIYKWGNERLSKAYCPAAHRRRIHGRVRFDRKPNAGSDSGGTQTTAVRDGDHYVLERREVLHHERQLRGTFICTAVTDPKLGRERHQRFRRAARHEGLQDREGRDQARHARLRLGQPRVPGRAHSQGSPARAGGRGLQDLHEDARRRPHFDRRRCRWASRRARTTSR
jgi:alkylation response protein AidB-like acyl-CoA dehydrogenase